MPVIQDSPLNPGGRTADAEPVFRASSKNPGTTDSTWSPQGRRTAAMHVRQLQTIRELLSVIGRGSAAGARRLASISADLAGSFRDAIAAQRTFASLSRLDDEQLADIGLRRDDILAAVFRRPVRRRCVGSAPAVRPPTVSEEPVVHAARKVA